MEEATFPQPLRTSPLARLHKSMGAVSLLWNNMFVPARYTSDINSEHFAIRTNAGLTDMTGIHKVFLSGIEAFEFLNHTVTRNLSTVEPGSAVYTVLLNNVGKVIDDAIVFHLDDQAKTSFKAEWLICLGAGLGHEYIQKQVQKQGLNIYHDENIVCLLLQGPRATTIILPILTFLHSNAPQRFQHKLARIGGYLALVSRTSYSGEDGFEIFVEKEAATKIWFLLISKGAIPVGFDALNIARIEAGLLFFGKDMTGNETPTELGLNFVVDFDDHSFRGKTACLENWKKPKIKAVGITCGSEVFELEEKELVINGKVRGLIQSYARSEWLEKMIGIAHIDTKYATDGQLFLVGQDDDDAKPPIYATVCSRRFYNQLL
ncbi:aminomethyltransferase family protein [Alphaproteobacteria bacterium]|nr:aminomethyltransferase family protein [Alphaproteobacteria bacterium]